MSDETMNELLLSLSQLPKETEWLEFKTDNQDRIPIARDISALANSAAYCGRDCAYKIWGITDGSHELVGTEFHPLSMKVGNQLLPTWLKRVLSSNVTYEFSETHLNGKRFVILTIWAAVRQPVTYEGVAYIREGSSTTRLESGSEREAELWRRLQTRDFEGLAAKEDVRADEVGDLLNVGAYYDALGLRPPSDSDAVLGDLVSQDLLLAQDNARYSISNLGALLIAKRLTDFPGLRRRQLRIVQFEGTSRLAIIDDRFFDEGYVTALPAAEDFLMSVTPAHEELEGMYRRVRNAFPRAAVRELLANTVIHQDLSNTMQYPEVHVFEDRLEFSNPGTLLVPEERILNALPKTRNGRLVDMLRLMDICEEEGTGWDVTIEACEAAHLLSPKIRSVEGEGTTVTLFCGGGFDRMTKRQRMAAVYWHACLMFAQRSSISNQSVRERFGLDDSQKSRLAVSRLIRECCERGLIKDEDPDAGSRYRRYVPAWS